MTYTAFMKYVKLHGKTIAICSAIGFVFILLMISANKSKQIQALLLKLQIVKVQNDVAVINHTITVNNQSIAGLDASDKQAAATIASVARDNASAQAQITAKQTTIDQLAKMYQDLNG